MTVPARLRRAALVLPLALLSALAGTPAAGASPAPAAPSPVACPAAAAVAQRTAPGTGRTVALTFDDGPGPETPRVLAVLAAHRVHATFFELGAPAGAWPQYTRAVVAAGDLVGDHTFSHPDLARLGPAAQGAQIDRGRSVLQRLTGAAVCTFRPPYGSFTATTLRLAAARRLRTITWDVDTLDWAAPTRLDPAAVARIERRAEAGASLPHPVILMHDGGRARPNMLAALPHIIDFYAARGYRFVLLAPAPGSSAGRPGLAQASPARRAGAPLAPTPAALVRPGLTGPAGALPLAQAAAVPALAAPAVAPVTQVSSTTRPGAGVGAGGLALSGLVLAVAAGVVALRVRRTARG